MGQLMRKLIGRVEGRRLLELLEREVEPAARAPAPEGVGA